MATIVNPFTRGNMPSASKGTKQKESLGSELSKIILSGEKVAGQAMDTVKTSNEEEDNLMYNDQLVKRRQAEVDGEYGSMSWADRDDFDTKWDSDNKIEYSSAGYNNKNSMVRLNREEANMKIFDAETKVEAANYSKGLSTVNATNPKAILTRLRQLDPSFKTETFFKDRLENVVGEIKNDKTGQFAIMSGSEMEEHFSLGYIKDKKIRKEYDAIINDKYVGDVVKSKQYGDQGTTTALATKLGISIEEANKKIRAKGQEVVNTSLMAGSPEGIAHGVSIATDMGLSLEVLNKQAKMGLSNGKTFDYNLYKNSRDLHTYPEKTEVQWRTVELIANRNNFDLSKDEGVKSAIDILNANKDSDLKLNISDFDTDSKLGMGGWSDNKKTYARSILSQVSLLAEDTEQAEEIIEEMWEKNKIMPEGWIFGDSMSESDTIAYKQYGLEDNEQVDDVRNYIYRPAMDEDSDVTIEQLGNGAIGASWVDQNGIDQYTSYSKNEFTQLVKDSKELVAADKIIQASIDESTEGLSGAEKNDARFITFEVDAAIQGAIDDYPELWSNLSKKDIEIIKAGVKYRLKNDVGNFNDSTLVKIGEGARWSLGGPLGDFVADKTNEAIDSAYEYLKQGMFLKTNKPASGSKSVDGKFQTVLMEQENSRMKGRNSDGYWIPHSSAEGGTDTIGYGHKLTSKEAKSGTIIIGGVSHKIDKGTIGDKEISILLKEDLAVAEALAKNVFEKKYPKVWDTLNRKTQLLATEIQFNVRGGLKGYPSFMKLASDKKTELSAGKEIGRTYTDKDGKTHSLKSRVSAFRLWYNTSK